MISKLIDTGYDYYFGDYYFTVFCVYSDLYFHQLNYSLN